MSIERVEALVKMSCPATAPSTVPAMKTRGYEWQLEENFSPIAVNSHPIFSTQPSTSRVRKKEKRNPAVTGRGCPPPCRHHLPPQRRPSVATRVRAGPAPWSRSGIEPKPCCALDGPGDHGEPTMGSLLWSRGLGDGRLAVVAGTAGWGIERGRVPVRRKWAAIGRALARWPAASRARPMLHDGVTIEMAGRGCADPRCGSATSSASPSPRLHRDGR